MAKKGWYKSGEELLLELRKTRLPKEMAAIWYFGQAGLAVRYGDILLAIDPYFGTPDPDVRAFPAPFDPEKADCFDAVLITHGHRDHLDEETLLGMAKANPKTKIILPVPLEGVARDCGFDSGRIIGAKIGDEIHIGEGVVIPFPAFHETFEQDKDGNAMTLGYIIRFPAFTLYHAGDTVEWDTMTENLKPYGIDVAVLPINGSDWKRRHANIIGNLNAREAADIAEEIGADLLIPLHYDLFPYNAENPSHLVDYMVQDHPGRKYHIMAPGERFIYMK